MRHSEANILPLEVSVEVLYVRTYCPAVSTARTYNTAEHAIPNRNPASASFPVSYYLNNRCPGKYCASPVGTATASCKRGETTDVTPFPANALTDNPFSVGL